MLKLPRYYYYYSGIWFWPFAPISQACSRCDADCRQLVPIINWEAVYFCHHFFSSCLQVPPRSPPHPCGSCLFRGKLVLGGVVRWVSWMDVLRILLIFACPFVHGHWLTKYFCQECKAKGKINNILPNQHSSVPREKPMNNFPFFLMFKFSMNEWNHREGLLDDFLPLSI